MHRILGRWHLRRSKRVALDVLNEHRRALFDRLFSEADYGFATPEWIRLLANFSFGSFAVLYLVGLKTNMDESRIDSPWQRLGWILAQLAVLPLCCCLESAGVLMALLRPVSGFHVVKK